MSFLQNQIGLIGSEGYIYMTNAGTTVSFAMTASYSEFTALSTSFILASPSQDFAMTTDGRLKYTGLETKSFAVDASLGISVAVVGNIAIAIYKNGSATGFESFSVGVNSPAICQAFVSLATNDYLSLFTKSNTNQTINIYGISLSATSMEGT